MMYSVSRFTSYVNYKCITPQWNVEGLRTSAPSNARITARSHDVRDFYRSNKARNKVEEWKHSTTAITNRALNNAWRLQSNGRRNEYRPLVADADSEITLMRYTRIELVATSICLLAMVISGIGAFYVSTFFVATILSAWLATIAYRLYKHHMGCYLHIRMLSSQFCPHCGKSLAIIKSSGELAAPVQH